MDIAPWVLEVLACPACHAPLQPLDAADGPSDTGMDGGLRCTSETCGLIYPVRGGIPVLLLDEARRPGAEGS